MSSDLSSQLSAPAPPASTADVSPARADDSTSAAPPSEARTFELPTAPGAEASGAARPQADFGAPIDIGAGEPDTTDHADAEPVREIPPLIAEADENPTPHFAEPRSEPVLTRRISQGLPSYAEPDRVIAGVVGRSPEGGDEPVG